MGLHNPPTLLFTFVDFSHSSGRQQTKINGRKTILLYIFENFDVWALSSCLSLSRAGQGRMGSQSQCRGKMLRHGHKNKTCYPSWLATHIWRNNEMTGEDETLTVCAQNELGTSLGLILGCWWHCGLSVTSALTCTNQHRSQGSGKVLVSLAFSLAKGHLMHSQLL